MRREDEYHEVHILNRIEELEQQKYANNLLDEKIKEL